MTEREQLEGMNIEEIEEKYDMWADDYNLDPQDIEWLFEQVKTLRKLTKMNFNRTVELSRENKHYREALEEANRELINLYNNLLDHKVTADEAIENIELIGMNIIQCALKGDKQ